MCSDVFFSLTVDSQTYAAPNWLLKRWCRGTTDCGLGVAGATELQRGHLQLSLLGHELALRVCILKLPRSYYIRGLWLSKHMVDGDEFRCGNNWSSPLEVIY